MNANVNKRYILSILRTDCLFNLHTESYYFYFTQVVWPFAFEYWPWILNTYRNRMDEKWRVEKKSIPEHNYLYHYYQATVSKNGERIVYVHECANGLPTIVYRPTNHLEHRTPNMAGTIHNTQIGKSENWMK